MGITDLRVMSLHLIPHQLQLQLEAKRSFIALQLEVAVSQKQPKVHTKVMNVPTVVHVMEKVVYVHVTKVTPANPAKHKQFWFKFAKKRHLEFIAKSEFIYEIIVEKV